jgi:protein SMG6
MMHNLLDISLAPTVPASLRNIPTKYNIITRLWTIGFWRLLESLRRAACGTPRDAVAFEHLQDFIYFAYAFYCGLLEEHSLETFKANWLEALGDLARYRMTVAAMATSIYYPPSALTSAAIATAAEQAAASSSQAAGPAHEHDDAMSDVSAARIDESPVPSIGVAAARALELEPEKERWRKIARDWYSAGVANTPGAGKLHHHLGLLSRELEEEELRGTYYFCKRSVLLIISLLTTFANGGVM